MFTLVASHGLNSNNRRGTHAMEKSFNCELANSEGSHVTSTPLMPVLCWPPAKPPSRLRCRQGRFYKWKRESFHFTPTPSLYCENLLCAERNHIISTHTLDICHYATRCCNKTSNWIFLKTVKFGGAGGMRSKTRDPCALLAQVNSQEESTQLGVTYREFRGCSTFTTVAEEPVLWGLSSLRHLHGEAQRLTSERQPLNGSALWVTHN